MPASRACFDACRLARVVAAAEGQGKRGGGCPGARSRMLVVAQCDSDRTIGDDARKSFQRARRRLTLGRSHPGKERAPCVPLSARLAAPAGPAFYPVATMCQIDPNVLISSPV